MKVKDNTPKKHFHNIISNKGTPDALITRYPVENFNNNSTLIVDEGQEAIFLKDGLAEEPFQPGSYTLNTDNYPFLTRFKSIISGGESKFNCRIYFVRKNITKEYVWGTPDAILVRDPIYDIQVKIRANGAYVLQIEDAKTFMSKLATTLFKTYGEYSIASHFKEQIASIVDDDIKNYISNGDVDVLNVLKEKKKMEEIITNHVRKLLEGFGLKLYTFVIKSISYDEDQFITAINQAKADVASTEIRRKEVEELARQEKLTRKTKTDAETYDITEKAKAERIAAKEHAEASKLSQKKYAEGAKEASDITGLSTKEQLKYNLLRDVANNKSGHQDIAKDTTTGLIIGQQYGNAYGSLFNESDNNQSQHNSVNENANDYVQVNEDEEMTDSLEKKLEILKQNLEEGIMTEEEYDEKKTELLKKYGF